MKRAVFVLGTPERRSVGKGEMLTQWTFDQLNKLAEAFDLDASIVFAVSDPYLASKPKTEIGIDRIRASTRSARPPRRSCSCSGAWRRRPSWTTAA